jgi:RNA polymerase sigma factor for flagellar operon FliA
MPRNPDIALLWRRYATRKDAETRAALVLAYWPLVKEVAASLRAKLPSHVDEADLTSAGLFGLMDAIARFDPAAGQRFAAFARARIRGAMIDDLRAADWAPRHVREHAREVWETGSALEQRLGRRATYQELAAALGLTPEQVHARLARNLLSQVAALDAELPAEASDEPVRLIDTIEDAEADDPEQTVAAEELRAGIVAAITSLPWRERRVLTAHYRRGLTFREIARSLGVSESRVFQIHTQAMRRLRDEILALVGGDTIPLATIVDAIAEALEELEPAEAAVG